MAQKPSPKDLSPQEKVGKAIADAMVKANLTAKQVCLKLEETEGIGDDTPVLTEKKLYNIRGGTTALPLHLAMPLAKVIKLKDGRSDPRVIKQFGFDPYAMLRLLDLEPRSLAKIEYERLRSFWPGDIDKELLIKLQSLASMQRVIVEHSEQRGTADNILRRFISDVVENGEYGVGVWPVFAESREGKQKFHYADRIDLLHIESFRSSKKQITEKEVWNDLHSALMAADAWPSISKLGYPLEPKKRDNRSRWTLRRVNLIRQPRITQAHPNMHALVISATVSSSWASELGGVLATVLGYGFITTADLARNLEYQYSLRGEVGKGKSTPKIFLPTNENREIMHSQLLQNPSYAQVWAHVSRGHESFPSSPFAPEKGTVADKLIHVRLVESDELLEKTQRMRKKPVETLELWKAARDEGKLKAEIGGHLILEIKYDEDSRDMWDDTFDRAKQVLEELVRRKIEPEDGFNLSQEKWAIQDPILAAPILRWLGSLMPDNPWVVGGMDASRFRGY